MPKYIVEVTPGGNQFWRNEKDQLHRLDGPAIVLTNGYTEHWRNGVRILPKKTSRKQTMAVPHRTLSERLIERRLNSTVLPAQLKLWIA